MDDPARLLIGVVGLGTMGAGIAQLALEHGHEVVVHEVDEVALERGRARVRQGLARRAGALDLGAEAIDRWVDGRLERLRDAETLTLLAGQTDVVIEAVLEDLGLKREVFRVLDAAAEPAVVLATNTSALPVAAIAQAAERHPERVLGLHFFNPVSRMRLVEVVAAPPTAPGVVDRALALVRAWDREPVLCADAPGFVVNRVNRPFTIEALRLLEAGEASVEAIDEALRAAGFPMGPFELMDLVGIDVNLAAARGVWEGLGRPDRLRPSPIQEHLVAEGRLGRKAGVGFYRYEGGRPAGIAPEFAGGGPLPGDEIAARILAAVRREARLAVEAGVAGEREIDLALRLGAGHPRGPFEPST